MKRRFSILFLLVGLTACGDWFTPPGLDVPSVAEVTPAPDEENVPISTSVNAELELPNGDLNVITVSDSSVRLVEADSGAVVPANVIVSNDSGTLTLTPTDDLEFGTEYRFEISSEIEDESGAQFEEFESTFATVSEDVPAVTGSRPGDGQVDVPLDAPIAADINTDGGVDPSTLTDETVLLTNVETGERLPGIIGTTGGGDAITFQPLAPLEPNTQYRFEVTSGVKDESGVSFVPYSATFTTAGDNGSNVLPGVEFEKVQLSTTLGERHTSLAFGPDGDLYASTFDGRILHYPVNSDGTLGTPETFNSLVQEEGGPRLAIGLTFDPDATASNPILWVSHTAFGVEGVDEPWSGKITRLSGPNLENVQDYVVGLPRSFKDHVTNSIAFNPREPDVLYFLQGSNTAMGAPDSAWGFQPERLLTAAVLRVDLTEIANPPLDVQTEDGGSYDPFEPGAPLTIYARGIRNAYDLVWHSNGNLYVPANGSASGGNIPRFDDSSDCSTRPDDGYNGPVLDDPSDVNAPYLSDQTDGWKITQTQHDYLFNVEEDGYYGHPNPERCEWIMNGGGTADDSTEVEAYPGSVQPDPNYRGIAHDFGRFISPNGAIEYQNGTFSGVLENELLVVRYSTHDDIVVVKLDGDGDVISETPIVPASSFVDPLDLAEDPSNGYLYVSEFDDLDRFHSGVITLLRPVD